MVIMDDNFSNNNTYQQRRSSICRLHRKHAEHRCGLFGSHIAWSVCLSVCVLDTWVSCAKTAEPIDMAFAADSCVAKEPGVRWGVDPPVGRSTFEGELMPACGNVDNVPTAGECACPLTAARGNKTDGDAAFCQIDKLDTPIL